jgi:hypothetical protein
MTAGALRYKHQQRRDQMEYLVYIVWANGEDHMMKLDQYPTLDFILQHCAEIGQGRPVRVDIAFPM